MRPGTLLYFYGRRLRTHPIQELLAGLGIAIGVALTFAVLVANNSITGSAREITRGLAGAASLQVVSRDSAGFDERLADRVRRIEGVVRVSALLEQRAILVGPNGRHVAGYVAGADPSLAALGGVFTRNVSVDELELRPGVLLPRAMAEALGLPGTAAQTKQGQRQPRISLHVRGRAFPVTVGAVLGREAIGPTADAMAALALRSDLQRFAGLPGRATRVLVQVETGREAAVRAQLTSLAAGRLTVSTPEGDSRLLEQATAPNDRATAFFAMISALIGLLLAFNAMLLTTPERRRMIAELRIQGFRPRQLATILMFQAAVLGICASAAGLLAGALLARGLFDETPGYLAAAFPIGTQTIVSPVSVLLSFLGGVAATCLAAAPPLLDLRRSRAVDAVHHEGGEPGHALSAGDRSRLLVTSIGLLFLTSGLLLVTASATLVAVAGLAIATLLAIPAIFAAVLRVADFVGGRIRRLSILNVALFGLRATSLRSLALAATGAVAVFGAVAIGGARQDLLDGIERYIRQHVDTADLWVANGVDSQATKDFRRGDLPERLAATPGVDAVRAHHGGYLDFDGRRAWVIARPGGRRPMIPATEVVAGDAAVAEERLRRGGWISISDQIAADHDVEVGDTLALPTPTGTARYRVAATTTNLGWPPGALVLNSSDYRRAWSTSDPTALEVDLRSGADPAAVKDDVQHALGSASALRVQTADERTDQAIAQTRQGLERLSQISTLLLIAAALSMAAAMGAAIWQRRASLAALRLQSFRPSQLRQILMLEAGLILGASCLTGAVTGVYGQVLIDRYLTLTTGFSAPFSPAGWQTGQTTVLVLVTTLAAVAVPGYLAARAPSRLGLQE